MNIPMIREFHALTGRYTGVQLSDTLDLMTRSFPAALDREDAIVGWGPCLAYWRRRAAEQWAGVLAIARRPARPRFGR